jgi:hypothetical protein
VLHLRRVVYSLPRFRRHVSRGLLLSAISSVALCCLTEAIDVTRTATLAIAITPIMGSTLTRFSMCSDSLCLSVFVDRFLSVRVVVQRIERSHPLHRS